MATPAAGWKILFDAATQSFLSGAFLPWFFLTGVNVFIYETAVADGHSIIDQLSELQDFDQAIVLLIFFASVGGLAAISTAAGDFILSFFGVREDFALKHAIGLLRSDEKNKHFLADLDKGQSVVQSMGTLFFGLYLTIIIQAICMYRWESSSAISLTIIASLAAIVLAILGLITSQAREVRREIFWLRQKIPTLISFNEEIVFAPIELQPKARISEKLAMSLQFTFCVIPFGFVLLFAINHWIYGGSLAGAPVRTASLLSINDVYRLTGPDRGAVGGGLARVRALRAKLEIEYPELLLLHAGDFLSPSLLGKTYEGEQMIDVMNLLDGKDHPGVIDPRMFVVFGNHEFDDTNCEKEGPLASHIRESDFTYLVSNLGFEKPLELAENCKGLHEVAKLSDSEKILRHKIVKTGGLTIGLYGLTISEQKYGAFVNSEYADQSCKVVEKLRDLNVDVIVALTHLDKETDLALLGQGPGKSAACTDYPDVIVGGHDHTRMALPENGKPRLFKADAEAISANQIILSVDKRGEVTVKAINHELSASDESDGLVQSRAESWFERHDRNYCLARCEGKSRGALRQCKKAADAGLCLKETVATLGSLLVADETKNRSEETGFGDWFTDRIRENEGVDVALFNSGGIRLNHDIKAGSKVTTRHLAEMFPFPGKIKKVTKLPGAQLWRAIDVGLSHPGEGHWLHFSGLAAKRDSKGRLDRLVLLQDKGEQVPISKDSTHCYSVASIDFLFQDGGKHGFDISESGLGECANAVKKEETAGQVSSTGETQSDTTETEEPPHTWPKELPRDPVGFAEDLMRSVVKTSRLTFKVDWRICSAGQQDCLIESAQSRD